MLGVAVLATLLLLPSVARATADDIRPDDRAERLQVRAQNLYDEGRYLEAADAWLRILTVLTENEVNRDERDTHLQLALEAYADAYLPYLERPADDVPQEIANGLARGVEAYRTYRSRLRLAYGDSRSVSEGVREKGERLEEWLRRIEVEAPSPPPPPPPPCVKGLDPLCRADRDHIDSGVRLIAAGSVLLAGGLGTSSMIIVGAVRAKAARSEDPPRVDRTARGLIIGGSIATGVLVTAGGTLLGIGISKRLRYVAVAPVFRGRTVGLSVRGRF